MSFIARIFGRADRKRAPVAGAASIYYCKKGFLIATTYWDDTGWSGSGEPMVLLSASAEAQAVGEQVLRSIRASRSGLSKTELQAVTAGLFRLAAVSGWNGLEKQWDLVRAFIQPGEEVVTICPMRRGEDGGYVLFNDDTPQRCSPEAEAVGQMIVRIARGHPPKEAGNVPTSTERPTEVAPSGETGFHMGDRVQDSWGNRGTVIGVDADAQHGLGIVHVRFDDGRDSTLALAASGLERVK